MPRDCGHEEQHRLDDIAANPDQRFGPRYSGAYLAIGISLMMDMT
ncbi:hypothetical protein [Bradyrhizobium sp.]|nr:hypothetical protein [Bradyrhizobium sp.]